MNCDKCGKELGTDDTAADVDIDLSKGQRFSLVWCSKCAKEAVEESV